MTLQDLLNKTCLIGLTYLNSNGDVLKMAQYAGTVKAVDEEEGITISLMPVAGHDYPDGRSSQTTGPNFHLPPSLEPWFVAPKGHYKNAEHHIDIQNPDYMVTWDIVKKKDADQVEEGQQEWWEWHPRTAPPSVN